MYCPSCGNEIAVELKYCNRCGANLSLPTSPQVVTVAPVRLAIPSIVVGLTIIIGLGIIIGGGSQMAIVGVPPVALVWMMLFAVATLVTPRPFGMSQKAHLLIVADGGDIRSSRSGKLANRQH